MENSSYLLEKKPVMKNVTRKKIKIIVTLLIVMFEYLYFLYSFCITFMMRQVLRNSHYIVDTQRFNLNPSTIKPTCFHMH